MTCKIIAVRHGETEWNKIGKQQGHLDSPLSENGLSQAKALSLGLRNFKIGSFYSSDLGRAVQTSKIISEQLNLKYNLETGLRERNLGILQGLTKSEFKEKFPEEYFRYKSKDKDYNFVTGESILERFNRIINCLEKIALSEQNKTVLIVAHGGVLTSIFQKALELSINGKRKYSLFNGSINLITVSSTLEWKLESWGIVEHMEKFGLPILDDN